MNATNNSSKISGVLIDIERMMKKQQDLLENHVKKNPKDEAPKIKLRQQSAKIKHLKAYYEAKLTRMNNRIGVNNDIVIDASTAKSQTTKKINKTPTKKTK